MLYFVLLKTFEVTIWAFSRAKTVTEEPKRSRQKRLLVTGRQKILHPEF